MKNKTYLLLAAVLITCSAIAQTNVSGFINANTTWTLAGSPYIVVGNALLSHGYTLMIDPGVVVKFDTMKALQIDGELIAVGTAANRITFTSSDSTPETGDWAKLHFADTCVNAVFDASGNYLSGCIMRYCDVLYGGGLGSGAIQIESSSPYFSNCNIIHSAANGIYCTGNNYLLDSSSVKNCVGYGLFFQNTNSYSCGLTVKNDTLENNANGGIYFATNVTSNCPHHAVRINNNYFVSNNYHGAINVPTIVDSFIVSENYFINNVGYSNQAGILSFTNQNTNLIIECNHFLNNRPDYWGVIRNSYALGGSIRNNIFDGNINNSLSGSSVATITSFLSNSYLYFENNLIMNDSCIYGSCCLFSPTFTSTPFLQVKYNQFVNNTDKKVIQINGGLSANSNLNFIYIKHNNFSNPNSQYELYNSIPYGSPNIYADSNYWGGTNTAHIDSVIYDYFDFANQSVVYYSPILTSPAIVDTTCPPIIITLVGHIRDEILNTNIFPNPFTIQATISFNKEVYNATFSLYNLLGEKVAEVSGINGESFQFNRGNLRSGVYVFEMSEGKSVWRGKAVVY